jgi:LysM repeat protein
MAFAAYTVKPGDTLSRIAAQYGVTWQAIAQANGLTNANRLMVNQTLRIPVYSDDGGASYGVGGWKPPATSPTNYLTADAAGMAASAAAALEAAKKKAQEQQWMLYAGIALVAVVVLTKSRDR